MHRTPSPVRLLLTLSAVAVLLLGALLIVPTLNESHGSPLPRARSAGLTPFISPGGNTAIACDDVDTCTTAAITNVDAGDTLIVIVTEYTTSAGAPSSVEEVTSGGNQALTLQAVTPCIRGSGHGVTAIFGLADVTAQASVTFTADYPADEYYTIHAFDVEGTATAPFETAGTGVCSTAAGTTGTASVTTTVANDLVILGVEIRASTAVSATGGDTLVNDASTTGAELDSGGLLDEIDPSTGAISLSATFTSASWAAVAIALKPATTPLVSGSVTPPVAAIDAGQTIGLASTAATGGTTPISYQWYNSTGAAACSDGTLITGATGLTYTTSALPVGTYSYCVWATDSSTPTPQVVYSNEANITVNPALVVHVTPGAPSIDDGQNVTLTANATGGTGPNSYAWYADASCTGAVVGTSQNLTTADLTANATYCVVVTDSSYHPVAVEANDTVTVSAAPLSVAITPPAPSIDSGQSIELVAVPTGGTAPDSYAWYAGATCSGPVLGTNPMYETPPLTTTTTYCVAVTDSAHVPVTATATATVTVSAFPLTVTISPNAPAIDSGQNVTLVATPSGGTGIDTYAWYADGACTGAVLGTSQSYTTPALTATTVYCVAATDSSSVPATAMANDTVTVSALALSVIITPGSPSIDSGQSIALTAVPSGGTGSDSYEWYAGSICSGSVLSAAKVYTTSTLTATTTYCVAATDSAYVPVTANATATVTVSSAPLTVTITPNAPVINSGQDIQLTAIPSGGTGADAYAWYSGSVCSGSVLSTAKAYTTPALTATTTYCAAATDSAYSPVTANATDTVTVSPPALSVTITPSAPAIDSGQNVQLTAHPAGGVGADTYAWYSGPSCSGSVVGTSQAYTTPALTASTSYCVAATDSASSPVTATASATVTVSGSPLSVTITPAAPTIASGNTVQLTAQPSGGTGADSYAWYSGSTCSGTVLATTQVLSTPALTATTTYCVAVTDSSAVPATASATATVTVTAVSVPPPTTTGGPPSWEYPVVGAILAALLAVLLLFLLVRRRKNVTFTQKGLPPGTDWSIEFAGVVQHSTAGAISYHKSKGKHPYTVGNVSGYTGSPKGGTLEVGQKTVDVPITFEKASK